MEVDEKILDVSGTLNELKQIYAKLEPLNKRYVQIKDSIKQLRIERKELIKRIHEGIEKLVEMNRRLKEEKKIYMYTKHELKLINEELSEIREKIRKISEILMNKPKMDAKIVEKLKKESEQLELMYETGNFSLRDEKKVVERINYLREQLRRYNEYIEAKNEKKSCLERKAFLIEKRNELINELNQRRDHLNELKKAITNLRQETMALQRRKNEIDKEIANLMEEAEECLKKMSPLKQRKDEILEKFGIKASTLSFEQVSKLIQDRSIVLRRALESYKKGKKLTFEEFTTLVKYGLI
ncbi:MAG: hypothetical protein QXH96_01100 [Candidatus Geothermarchaeota archaeon]